MLHPALPQPTGQVPVDHHQSIPALYLDAGDQAWSRVRDFFTAHIRNPNTRAAYAQAALQFGRWCDRHGIGLAQVSPFLIATYIEDLQKRLAVPSVKQHLAAIRVLFDFLVVGQVVPHNPASPVRGPKHVVKKGLTPVLSGEEARELFDSLDVTTAAGLRDRALIGVMIYSFARVGAVVAMNVEDHFTQGKRAWFRLHEKGGKLHDVPAHHKADEFVEAYLNVLESPIEKGTPLFRTLDRSGRLNERRISRGDVLAMIKRRACEAGLSAGICCHSFRGTGITCYLLNGGTLEHAQRIAAHESPRTTKLYDRTSDTISLDEIERIVI